MKQLKTYLSALMAVLLTWTLTACQDDDEGKLAPWMEFTNETGEDFPSELNVSSSGATYTMNIFTNVEWIITTDVDWITANPSGKLGCTSGTLTVAMNETNSVRTGSFKLTTYSPSVPDYVVTVTQAAAPLKQEAYFITPEGSGEKTGADWENALDVAGFEDLITNALDLSTYPIYMSEGTYVSPSEKVFKPTKNISHIYGGYSSSSTGTDVTKMSSEPTIISGNNVNPIFDIVNCSIVFENVTFANGFTASDGTGSGIHISGNRTDTKVELIDCIVRDCVSETSGQNGAAITLAGGETKLTNVQILNNRARNRGAGICTNEATVGDQNDFYIFINNCTFRGNRLTEDWNWGADINARRGYICVNNSTFFGSESNGNNEGPINGDGFFIMSNSTFIGNEKNNWIIRHNGADPAAFVNCLFINNGAAMSLSSGDNKDSLTKGWNVFQGIDFTLSDTDTDASSFTFGNIDTNVGYYEWNANDYSIRAFATQQDVINAVRNTNNIGSEFADWIGASFGLDQRGEARNPNKMQPGAYDGNLN